MIEDGEGHDIAKGDLTENKQEIIKYQCLGTGRARTDRKEKLLGGGGKPRQFNHKSQESVSGERIGDQRTGQRTEGDES